MTLKIGNFTEHIRTDPHKYNLSVNITSKRPQRMKELGHSRYLIEKTRKQILERDNYTCQLCNQYGNQVDHIIPWRISHDNSPENLRVLCRKCNTARRLQRRDARLSYDEWTQYLEAELVKYKERQLALDLK